MDKNEIYKKLTKEISKAKIYMDEPMRKHTSFKIGGPADIFVRVSNIEEIKYIIDLCKKENVPFFVMGNGSNLLVKDKGIRGITIQINIETVNIEFENDEMVRLKVGAGNKLGALAVKLQQNGISGFEFAAGIPGTIGGAIRMNAGAYGGEFKDIVESITYLDENGNLVSINNSDAEFSYRHSRFCSSKDIIISATLKLGKADENIIKEKMDEYMTQRREKQPVEMPSAGSTFKRGTDFITAKIIDDAGLKGYSIGGAEVSTKHAGFVVNKGNATAKDVIDLTNHIKRTIEEKFGKEIELEIEIVGE